jgi:hypothetical protein
MKFNRLQNHFISKHKEHAEADLSFFFNLKRNFEARTTLTSIFSSINNTNIRVLEASYQISLCIAKVVKDHTIGENLIKHLLSIFLKTGYKKSDEGVKMMPLSNNTVSRIIDEMGEEIEKQLIKIKKFSLQIDESTLRDSEAVLMSYVRYIENEEFKEEMIFCRKLKSTSKSKDIFDLLKCYFNEKQIPFNNIVSRSADSAPNMMGEKNGPKIDER